MQQITLNIIFDGKKIRLDASGIPAQKRNRKSKIPMYAVNTIKFSNPAFKVGEKDNQFDIVFPVKNNCKSAEKYPDTDVCSNCYSNKLAGILQELRKSQRTPFIEYQVSQQENKEEWLKEIHDFVLDNERYLNENDYSTTSDLLQAITAKQDELNPESVDSNTSTLNIQELLANLNPQVKNNPKLKTNLTVPQLAYLFMLLYDLKPDLFDVKSKAELQRFISANFSTKGTEDKDISTEKLKQLFSDPDPDAAAFWRKHFLTMLDETRKFH